VKLTNKKFELEIQMNFIPSFQFDAKSFLLTKTMWLEITCMLVPFIDYLNQFDLKKNSYDVGSNVWS
jgi:hypothetical protein